MYMNTTAFELLGIENKELPISNLMSYYLNPIINTDYGLQFLNKFCHIAHISPVSNSDIISVEREHHIFFENEHNYIDILIRIGKDSENPKRIICIENKINSNEGIRQTQRYYNALQAEFPNCKNRQYIYLTKNNSSINLTSQHFIHIRYAELGAILAEEPFNKMPLAKDFYDFYILREKSLFQDIEVNDRQYLPANKTDFHTLIDYIVWKINVPGNIENNKNYFCLHGKSAQSNDHFFQFSMQNWEFELDDGNEKRSISIHLEGSSNEIPLHMEVKPYEPFNSLEKKYGSNFFEKYVQKRNELRKSITFENTVSYENLPIRKNAELTIAKFKITADTFKEYFDALIKLVTYINEILVENGIVKNS